MIPNESWSSEEKLNAKEWLNKKRRAVRSKLIAQKPSEENVNGLL